MDALRADAHDAEHETARGIRVAFVAYVLWGLLTIFWKQLSRFNAFELIGWRIISATIVMSFVVTVTRRWGVMFRVFTDRRLVVRIAMAATLLTANWSAYMYAVVHDHVIETALGYFMAPLGTMALGIFVHGEQPTRLQKMAMASASIAVVVLTVASGRPPVAALVIAVSWSFYGLLKRQVPLNGVESFAAETFMLLVPAVILVTAVASSATSVPSIADSKELAFVALSGVATSVPLVLFAFSAPRVPFTVLGPMQYIVPTINFLLGWLFYDEHLPWTWWVGFVFIWTALVLVTYNRVRTTVATRQLALVSKL